MDKDKVRELRVAMQDALSLIEKDFGVKFTVGNASLTSSYVVFKVEGAEVAADGVVQTQMADAYARLASLYGLDKHPIGSTFAYRGQQYRIRGLNSKAGKFPVIADRVNDGKGFKFPVEAVTGQRLGFADHR